MGLLSRSEPAGVGGTEPSGGAGQGTALRAAPFPLCKASVSDPGCAFALSVPINLEGRGRAVSALCGWRGGGREWGTAGPTASSWHPEPRAVHGIGVPCSDCPGAATPGGRGQRWVAVVMPHPPPGKTPGVWRWRFPAEPPAFLAEEQALEVPRNLAGEEAGPPRSSRTGPGVSLLPRCVLSRPHRASPAPQARSGDVCAGK